VSDVEQCLEAQLCVVRDAQGVVHAASWTCDGEEGYPRLEYDPASDRGTLAYSVEIDRFEAGTLREEHGHPWGDSGESTRTLTAAAWLDEALGELRARMIEHLSGKRRGTFSDDEAEVVVAYLERHGFARHLVGNTDVRWQPFMALARRLAPADPAAAARRFGEAAQAVAGDEQRLGRVLQAAAEALGRDEAARAHAAATSLGWATKVPLDELLAVGGGRICAAAIARLRGTLEGAGLTATWGAPVDPAAAAARWQALGGATLPPSFADFLRSHGGLIICRDGKSVCELFEPARWQREQVTIDANRGAPRPLQLLVFGELVVEEDGKRRPRSAAYLLEGAERTEPQCGLLLRGEHTFNGHNYLEERQLGFAAWLDRLGRVLVPRR